MEQLASSEREARQQITKLMLQNESLKRALGKPVSERQESYPGAIEASNVPRKYRNAKDRLSGSNFYGSSIQR